MINITKNQRETADMLMYLGLFLVELGLLCMAPSKTGISGILYFGITVVIVMIWKEIKNLIEKVLVVKEEEE